MIADGDLGDPRPAHAAPRVKDSGASSPILPAHVWAPRPAASIQPLAAGRLWGFKPVIISGSDTEMAYGDDRTHR
jgi:hypothetical protein